MVQTTNKLTINQQLQQKLLPQTLQSLKILAMPVISLETFMEKQLIENPLLEVNYLNNNEDSLNDQPYSEMQDTVNGSANNDSFENYDPNTIGQEHMANEFDYWHISHRSPVESDYNNMSEGNIFNHNYNIPETETLPGFLHLQLSLSDLNDKQYQIASSIIDAIDSNGYFSGDLAFLANKHQVSQEEVLQMLEHIQTFAPLGVGARNLSECLLLQLNKQMPLYDILADIIKNDIDMIADNKITCLAGKYHIPAARVQNMVDFIRTLDPRPGSAYAEQSTTHYIIPDVIVKKSDNTYYTVVNDMNYRSLAINNQYLEMAYQDDLSYDDRCYIRNKNIEAQNILKSIEMRYKTLKKLTDYIISEQHDFVAHGIDMLKPMTMQQAADALGIHISTVSRAISQKYIQLPNGTYPLKFFFSTAVSKQGGTDQVSSSCVKKAIAKIIEEEDALKPLSDQQITVILTERGYDISRRTVAKYRQEANLPPQSKRRRFV